MAIFEDVTLGWKGEEFTVPANKVMRLIAKIEDEITLQELGRESGPPMAKVAMAYAVALNYAGHRTITADDVYESMFSESTAQDAANAVTALMMIMVPPSTYQPPVDPKPKAKTQKKKSV